MSTTVSAPHVPVVNHEVWIAGAGVSGRGSVDLATRLGWKVCVVDDRSDSASELAADCGGRALSVADAVASIDQAELIVTSPGWKPTSPLLAAAKAHGVPVIGDVELAWCADQDGCFGTPRTWVVITGTNGKTTTTAMAAAMVQQAGRAAEAVGNIGVAVGSAVTAVPRIDVMVAELSSFQLHWSPTLTPNTGALLNLAEDHLDWHGSMQAYAQDKARALRGPIAVYNADDPLVVEQVAQLPQDPDRVLVGFTLGVPEQGQIGVVDGRLIDRAFSPQGQDVDMGDATSISPAGPAGVADALAAAGLARSLGVSGEAIAKALEGFQVRAHRGQVVFEHGGVKWIDNSKATNPHAASAALASCESVVWVVGGQLKGASLDEVVKEHAHRLKAAIVLGQDRRAVVNSLNKYAPDVRIITVTTSDPKAAMDEVGLIASRLAHPGDVVLLAPAAASLDMYTGMAQRGDFFAQAAAQYGTQGPVFKN